MRRFLCLLTFVLIVCLVQTVEARKLALLIGVDEYVNVPSLKCCVSDMKTLKEALMKIGFEEDDIQILVTGGAYKNFPTKKNIEKHISQIVLNAQPSDMVFLALSGHGAQDGKNVYFCPPDVEIDDLKGTCVSINKVMDALANRCKAKFKWMVVDACRNDPTRGAKGIGGKGLQVIPTPPAGIALFQSCAEGEESWEDRDSGNGYFTKNFAAALSGEADSDRDGKLTLFEVCKWTTAHTKEQVKNNQNKSQRPYFSGSVSDFTLTENLNVPKARTLIEEARKAIEEEKYELAVKKYDEAIALCPQYSYIKRERATAQRLLNAENQVKIEQKQREEAEKKIKEERKPKDGNEHDRSAPIADFEDVEPDYEKENVPDNPVSAEDIPEIQEGLKALQNNDVEGALAKFEDARKSHPEFSPAELMLAKLALQLNSKTNGPAARMLIERCVKNNPTDPEAFIFLGDYNLGNGSVTEADLLFRQAGILLKYFRGNAQRKSAMIRQYNAGMTTIQERRDQQEFSNVLREANLDLPALQTTELTRVFSNAQDYDDAREIPEIRDGLKALLNNDIEGALAKFEKARKYYPDFSPAELALAKLALKISPQKNGTAARMLIERCVKKYPDDPEAFIFLGDWNLGNGSITEADLLFRQTGALLKDFRGNALRKSVMIRQFNAGMAMVLERRGQYEQAKAFMESYIISDPKNVAAYQQLARIYLNMGKPNDAIVQLTKAKELDKSIITPEAIVAMFYQQKGDKYTAATYMTKALDKAPRDVNTRLAAAQWSQMINRIDQAITQADAALQIDPKSEAAMLLRGNFALIQKDYDKAIEMYNNILTNSPSNFAASNNIALALCETGDKYDLKDAVQYARVNVQRFSSSPEAFSTLGYVLLKNGEVNDSLKALQQSLVLTNGRMSPDTAYYLCAALVAKGAPEGIKQAKEILIKTLHATPTFNMRPEAEKLMEELNKRDRFGY